MDYRWAFKSAATVFCDLVSRVPADRWEAPGLGIWTVRELVAHTASSALVQVPEVLGNRADTLAVTSPEAYWVFARMAPPELVAAAREASHDDARRHAAALDGDPLGTVTDWTRRAAAAVSAVSDEDMVASPIGGMRVRDWLPTRTFELVVHSTDLARAAGVEADFAPETMAFAVSMAARVAIATGDGATVLRALTGRDDLPAGFSVV